MSTVILIIRHFNETNLTCALHQFLDITLFNKGYIFKKS